LIYNGLKPKLWVKIGLVTGKKCFLKPSKIFSKVSFDHAKMASIDCEIKGHGYRDLDRLKRVRSLDEKQSLAYSPYIWDRH
jgi:hypothetical protein